MTQNRSGPPSGIGGTADDRAETNSSALLHEKPPRQFPQRLPRSETLQQRIEQDRAAGTLAEPGTKRGGAA